MSGKKLPFGRKALLNGPRYQPMVLCFLALVAGILLDHFLSVNWKLYFWLGLGSLVAWFGMSRLPPRWLSEIRSSRAGSSMILLVVMMTGAGWHHARWNWFAPDDIGLFAGDKAVPCCLEGMALTEPRWSVVSKSGQGLDYEQESHRTRVLLRVQRIRDGDSWRVASGKTDVIIHGRAAHFRSGDRLRVLGRLVRIGPPSNPGQFDFQFFYRAQRKLAVVHTWKTQCVEVVESASWWRGRWVSHLRQQLNRMTWKYVHDDEAAFASAIMLGNREQMSFERRQSFFKTGTVHLLAISGLHVGVLAGIFFLFFRIGWASRRQCLLATIVFVIGFAWLVEFRPPVTRATILIVLYCIARLYGHGRFSWNLLSIAGILVLLLNPLDLFGLGTQLSFLAVSSLIFGKDWVFWRPPRDPLKRLISSTRATPVRLMYGMGRQLRTAFLVSALIWWVAMPLVAYRFHVVAPVALLVNALLLLPIALALYGGLAVMVFGWLAPPLAKLGGLVCEKNLALVEWLIAVGQMVPCSYFWTSGPTCGALVLFYAGLFLTSVFPPTRVRLRWVIVFVVSWILVGWLGPDWTTDLRSSQSRRPLVCTFIDVGHGTSVLLQFPDGKNVLYDAGSFGSSNYGIQNISGVLWHERIDRLDAVIVSHADIDHFNAIPELSRRFGIRELIVSPQFLNNESSAASLLLSSVRESGVPVRTVVAGDFWSEASNGASCQPDDYRFRFLHPTLAGNGANDNAHSIVAMVEYGGHRILLPGDLESVGMDRLMAQPPIDTSVAMAPHHGSVNSDPEKFLKWATPELVVISAGNQRIGTEALKPFRQGTRQVLRTDRDGAIRLVVDSTGIQVMHWKENAWQSR